MKKTQIKIFLIFTFCALIVNTQAIKAQQYIGYHVQPNVIVNNDVIESIAPLPNIARSLLQIQRKKPVAASTKLKQLLKSCCLKLVTSFDAFSELFCAASRAGFCHEPPSSSACGAAVPPLCTRPPY